MTKFLFFCGIWLLPSVTTEVLASEHYAIAKQKSPKNTTRKKTKKIKSKRYNRHTVARNILSPFILRLLYAPSYRLLTEGQRDNIDETNDEGKVTLKIARIFPIATGVEGELAFNDMLSVAVGGSFSYHGEFFSWETDDSEVKDRIQESEVKFDIDYYEFTINSSLYVNANYFKLGPGIGLTFVNVVLEDSMVEKDKKLEKTYKLGYKKVSAHFSLRRDFFSAQGLGVGVGLTASMYVTDILDQRLESKECIDGKDCKTKTKTADDFDDDDDDKDNQGFYSAMLIPMIYFVF